MICGIDLGTTNSVIGVVEAGFPILLADAEGQRLTPSVVYWPENGEPVVGAAALRQRTVRPTRVVTSVKRWMGQSGTVGETGESPEAISALILKELRSIAEAAMGQPISRAVITVPAYFNDSQRAATKRAGELAGFQVERILNEPTAAALAFGLDKLTERARVAVFDFGGGTFDLTVLEMREGLFQVLATCGDTQLGGDDIDRAVAEWIESQSLTHLGGASAEGGSVFDPIARARMREAAISAKHALSTAEAVRVELPFLTAGLSLDLTLTREVFEALARPTIDRTRALCLRALADAQLEASALDAVVLVGGSTRIPLVRATAAQVFGREPDVSQHPDEAVALGATIQAGLLSGALRRDMLLLDVTPLSLGLETFGGLMNVIIPRNTTIPARAGELFTNAAAGQPGMAIRVLQGEREMARDNWALGEFEIAFEPGPKGSARVGVQFEIDADGLLRVLARDTKTQTDRVLEIRSAAVNVDDAAVSQMIAESVDYAFDDMRERILTEARHKADELLPAVKHVLAEATHLLEPGEAERIHTTAAAVRTALTGTDANALKAAVQALDHATEALAARLVEQAMDDAMAAQGLLG
jgi:molecular chaperone DnaK